MSRLFVAVVAAGLMISSATLSYAIKPLKDVFDEQYVGDSAKAELKALVKEANCNVCHIDKEAKKMRNPFGVAVREGLKDAKFSIEDFKKKPKDAKLVMAVKDVMKKLEDKKPKDAGADAKTFGQRMKAGMLPGGDKSGK